MPPARGGRAAVRRGPRDRARPCRHAPACGGRKLSRPAVGRPRPLQADLTIDALLASLPPADREKHGGAYAALEDKFTACTYRVAEPYNRRPPRISVPAGARVYTVYKSRRMQRIEDARDAAIYRTCGTRADLAKKQEAYRKTTRLAVQKVRAELFTVATNAAPRPRPRAAVHAASGMSDLTPLLTPVSELPAWQASRPSAGFAWSRFPSNVSDHTAWPHVSPTEHRFARCAT